jgi:hypothetical protein
MSVTLRKSGDGRPRTALALQAPGTNLLQDIVTATPTILTFAAANAGFQEPGGGVLFTPANTITVPRDGLYRFRVQGLWETGTGGTMTLELRQTPPGGAAAAFNDPNIIEQDDTNSEPLSQATEGLRFLTGGTQLQARVTQTSGGNLEFAWEAFLLEE